jgi:hypothetical protein
MTKETFKINDTTYTIQSESGESEEYVVRRSGCAIYRSLDLSECRKVLHGYALNQLTAEWAGYKTRADFAAIALNKLGTDPFHLGKFLQ